MKNQVAVEIGGRRYVLREAKRSPFPDCRSCAVRRFCDHDGEHFGHPLCLAVPHPADRFVRFVREKSPIRAARTFHTPPDVAAWNRRAGEEDNNA